MSVHYKFKNTIQWDNVKFDGVYITASDLKSIIVQQKKLGQSELQLENEETGQTYADDQMIPKNTNIVVIRLPFANSNKRTRLMASQPYHSRFSANANSAGTTNSNNHNNNNINSNNNNSNNTSSSNSNSRHHLNGSSSATTNSLTSSGLSSSTTTSSSLSSNADGIAGGREAMELVSTKTMSEEEKIKYIQSQSTRDFDPTRYARSSRGGGPGGRGGAMGNRPHYVPGPGYTCRKCGIPGHLIYECKSSMHKVKRSSGIPREFLVKVDSKEKGALMTPSGEYAVPYIDREAYNNPKIEKAPFFEDGTPSDDTTKATTTKAILTQTK